MAITRQEKIANIESHFPEVDAVYRKYLNDYKASNLSSYMRGIAREGEIDHIVVMGSGQLVEFNHKGHNPTYPDRKRFAQLAFIHTLQDASLRPSNSLNDSTNPPMKVWSQDPSFKLVDKVYQKRKAHYEVTTGQAPKMRAEDNDDPRPTKSSHANPKDALDFWSERRSIQPAASKITPSTFFFAPYLNFDVICRVLDVTRPLYYFGCSIPFLIDMLRANMADADGGVQAHKAQYEYDVVVARAFLQAYREVGECPVWCEYGFCRFRLYKRKLDSSSLL